MLKNLFAAVLLAGSLVLGGCAGTDDGILSAEEQVVKLRQMQSRTYDTTDKVMVMRAVLSTFQDLGFIIDRADEAMGVISATQFANVKMTVSVRVAGNQTIVRANAQYGMQAVEEPKPYQNFFNALSQSLFLAGHEVD